MTILSAPHEFPADHFLNREFSLLAFNRRVLAQAADDRVPLLERLRFLCIVSSNLDEFFEIRVAGIKEQIKLRSHATGADRLGAQEVFRRVIREAHDLIEDQYELLNDVHPASTAQRRHRLLQALRMDRSTGSLDPRLLPSRSHPRAHADRA